MKEQQITCPHSKKKFQLSEAMKNRAIFQIGEGKVFPPVPARIPSKQHIKYRKECFLGSESS